MGSAPAPLIGIKVHGNQKWLFIDAAASLFLLEPHTEHSTPLLRLPEVY
jgi:hypothetical protein